MIFAKPWADALIVLLVVLLFFGPKRLPALGRSLGEGMREFKDSITGKSGSSEEGELPSTTDTVAQPPAPPAPAVPADPTSTQQPPAPTPSEAAAPPVASSEPRS